MAFPTDEKIDLLVCDAVRQEADGKLSLTGFFPTAEVKLDAGTPLPVALNLTFVFVLKDGDGQFRATFRIVDPLGTELHRYEVPEFRKLPGQAHVMMLAVGRIPVAHSGNFAVLLEIGGERYRRALRIYQ
jgi:hypothetical protein